MRTPFCVMPETPYLLRCLSVNAMCSNEQICDKSFACSCPVPLKVSGVSFLPCLNADENAKYHDLISIVTTSLLVGGRVFLE